MKPEDVIAIRKKLSLTQEGFAEVIGVSKNTVYNWENGAKIPDSRAKMLKSFIHTGNEKPEDFNYNEESLSIDNNILKEPIESIKKGVPYYDVEFTAGFLEVTENHGVKPDSYIDHPFFRGCDYVVRASGQSMAKVICHGDAIGLIKINNWQEFFPFGEIYAIVTNDNFRMVKVITKGENEDTYTLISKPTDSKKDEFPPQQIKKTSIAAIFKVQASSHLF